MKLMDDELPSSQLPMSSLRCSTCDDVFFPPRELSGTTTAALLEVAQRSWQHVAACLELIKIISNNKYT